MKPINSNKRQNTNHRDFFKPFREPSERACPDTLGVWVGLLLFLLPFASQSQPVNILSSSDFDFLKNMTKDVVESSRIYPGQVISKDFGGNSTGGTLIRPGGRDCYPSFWIRDYAMSIESGFVTEKEQKHMLDLTAATQCNQTWITKHGSVVPMGAIADHIRIDDSKPVYYPGTYDFATQGDKNYGMTPPYCDQYYFIHMVWCYVKTTSSTKYLLNEINGTRLIDRLEMAYQVPPTHLDSVLVYTNDELRGIDFGFRDAINITGNLCYTSLLKYQASLELAELFSLMKRNNKAETYQAIAARIKQEIPNVFMDNRGMLLASTGRSKQADVWGTALAVYMGILEGAAKEKTCLFLKDAYQKGLLARQGNIRHILTTDDFSESTAWEKSLAGKNDYQNGGYWGTPTGWVCYAIAQVDVAAAKQLAKEYIDGLRTDDYRKGPEYGAPWECYNKKNPQNAVYMTTVSCPYITFSKISN